MPSTDRFHGSRESGCAGSPPQPLATPLHPSIPLGFSTKERCSLPLQQRSLTNMGMQNITQITQGRHPLATQACKPRSPPISNAPATVTDSRTPPSRQHSRQPSCSGTRQEGIPQLPNRHPLALPLHSGTREEPQRLIRGTAADRPESPLLCRPASQVSPRIFRPDVLVTPLRPSLVPVQNTPSSSAFWARRCVRLARTLGCSGPLDSACTST